MRDINLFTPEEFQKEVGLLLQLQGWIITYEKLLGHKKVDGYAERNDVFGKTQKIAIECKKHNDKLSREDVTQIYIDYITLIENSLIDFVLLVTFHPLAPSACTYVKEAKGIRHITYLQLLNSILDFSGYVRGFQADFSRGNMHKQYVAQDWDKGEGPLEEYLINWINNDKDNQPIAILGGYGIGKSTLTRRMAYLLAQEHIKNPAARIPIVISLADISTDQTLEGLLGRYFTSLFLVPNYNYMLFKALNDRGRLVFLLDGFDEMKKTMSWDSLRYNLSQLNQLVVQQSKVILLGRPTAFLTKIEHDEALHGRHQIRHEEKKIPDWPDYYEICLKSFSRQQIKVFISQFLDNLDTSNEQSDKQKHRIENYVEKLEGTEGKRLLDLASRPVQLKMLMEILPEHQGDIDQMTVAILFSEFIDLVIRRELHKKTREAFTVVERRKFATMLAYWMWINDYGSEIDGEKIPDSLFRGFVKDNMELHEIKRDLLAGCFLEKKRPNSFYFPHRSFQEFLVAEKLCDLAMHSSNEIFNCPFLTTEVISFFVELMGKEETLKWKNKMTGVVNKINDNCAELLGLACKYYGFKTPVKKEKLPFPTPAGSRIEVTEEPSRKLLVNEIISSDSVKAHVVNIEHKIDHKKGLHRIAGVTKKSKYKLRKQFRKSKS